MSPEELVPEETLDPADWDALRSLGHRMLDDAFDHMQGVRERPVWQAPPEEARASFTAPLPLEGTPAEAVYAQVAQWALPYGLGNDHPRFWGWPRAGGAKEGRRWGHWRTGSGR